MNHLFRACLITLLFAAPALAQSADATGTWAITVNAPDRAHQATMELTQKGEILTGSVKSPGGELPVTGTSKGSELSIVFMYNDTRVTLTGKIGGDTIAGPATFNDERATGPESAALLPELRRAPQRRERST